MKSFCFALFIALVVYVNQAFGAEAGMPQLNPEFWAAQIFWLILIFSTLYLIIWRIFLPKITYSIENRKSRVVNDLDEAQKLKESAEKKLREYNGIIEIRGAGLLLGIKTKQNNVMISNLLIKNKLLNVPSGDNVIRLAPPLIINKKHADEALNIINKTFKKIT